MIPLVIYSPHGPKTSLGSLPQAQPCVTILKMRKCNYGVLKPVSADKTCQERRDRKRVPVGAALVLPRPRRHQHWEQRARGCPRRTAQSHPPLSTNQLAVNSKCNPDREKKALKSPPCQFRELHTPFTLGHAASHPVCPQRGTGSRAGCSGPDLPCTSLSHLSGSFALCGEAISYAFTRAEHRDSYFPSAAQNSSPYTADASGPKH